MFKLYIDPGHGGSDSGASANGLLEKNITLLIASKIRDIFRNEYQNVSIKMSRTKDQTVSLTSRTNEANKWGADFYLSIHINSGGGTGFESYVYPKVGRPTTIYHKLLHEEVMNINKLKDRGRRQADFHVLRESNMPAVLTENGFIDNEVDARKMKDETWLDDVARGHVYGLAKAFNLK
ncbi:hypothetical protein J19TS1_20310 [Heyndrickxia oleronia]|nr:hypothetical protein J19TS1_20310 [Heyndrickxia oleronia]